MTKKFRLKSEGKVKKSQRIRDLKAMGHDNHAIAARVGCGVQYVRVVLNQRCGGRLSKSDQAYLAKVRKTPEWVAKARARSAEWKTDNRAYYLAYNRRYNAQRST